MDENALAVHWMLSITKIMAADARLFRNNNEESVIMALILDFELPLSPKNLLVTIVIRLIYNEVHVTVVSFFSALTIPDVTYLAML